MQDDARSISPGIPQPQPDPPFRPRVWRPDEPRREVGPLRKPIGQMSKLERRQLAGTWTLTDLYNLYVWPHSLKPRGRKEGTRREHLVSLKKWEAICGHPPLVYITQELGSYFVEQLSKQPGLDGKPMSPTTVVKHCVHLQMVLDHAGPGNLRRHIIGAKLLRRKVVPYLQRPGKAKVDVQDPITLDQLNSLLEACSQAKTPRVAGIDPCTWWQACYLFCYNTALRRQTVLAARWDWLDDEGWLSVPAAGIKGERAAKFWCNQYALAAIEPLRPAGYEEIFPWPNGTNWFHHCCEALFDAAGIQLHGESSRRRGLHRLRSTLGTWLIARNDTVAKIVLNHRGGVTKEHYAHRKAVVDLLKQVPQPGSVKQQLLFDV